jgi:HEAT repeat protein
MLAMAALASPGRNGGSALVALVQDFDRQPGPSRAAITTLLERDERAFYDGALQVMKAGGPSRGTQLVASLLVSSGLIQQALAEPSLTFDQAVSLVRMALQSEPATDINLARQLAEDSAAIDPRAASRLIDILSAISPANRITPFVLRLLRHSDPTIRSKAVLFVGRSSRSVKWVRNRLAETDPRTRASAVEALWGVEGNEARELLRIAARDGNNRVAGNALIALFRLGDVWMAPELLKMASSESAPFRATAAWVMGETGDPRFKENLAKLVGESDSMVRRRAFLALSRLKTAAQARQGREWIVTGRVQPSSGNWRQVRVEVAAAEGAAPVLLPTHFGLFEDGKPVLQYQVEERTAEAVALTLLLPRPMGGGAASWLPSVNAALQRKRPSDLWQVLHYLSPAEAAGAPSSDGDLAPFFQEKAAIARAFSHPPPKFESSDFWETIQRCTPAGNAPARGIRHVIAVVLERIGPPGKIGPSISTPTNAHTAVHAITRFPCSSLEDLCRRSQGSYKTFGTDLELLSLLEAAALAMLGRFHVSYLPPAPGGRMLTVKACNSKGFGEALVLLA